MWRHALAALLATAAALYKVDIHIAGRAPSPKSWEAAAVDEYAKRLRGQIDVKTTWHKSGDQLERAIAKMEAVLCLSLSRGKTGRQRGLLDTPLRRAR